MHIKPLKNGYLLSSHTFQSSVNEQWFSPLYWQHKSAIVGSKEGRATAWFYRFDNDLVYVLKHFWRGGLVGKLLSDQYLYTGLKNTRVYKEFLLLCQLHDKGLPVPSPKAAQVKISGIIYKGDLITEAINGAKSVCEICQKRSLTIKEIKIIAKTIGKFHSAGVYHADLNINNILFDNGGKVYLIDFDRGRLRVPHHSWQKNNLKRLKRSFDKEALKWPAFYFTTQQWQELENNYLDALK